MWNGVKTQLGHTALMGQKDWKLGIEAIIMLQQKLENSLPSALRVNLMNMHRWFLVKETVYIYIFQWIVESIYIHTIIYMYNVYCIHMSVVLVYQDVPSPLGSIVPLLQSPSSFASGNCGGEFCAGTTAPTARTTALVTTATPVTTSATTVATTTLGAQKCCYPDAWNRSHPPIKSPTSIATWQWWFRVVPRFRAP